jgi:hypothetical protein
MQIDNLPCLEPYKTKDEVPNEKNNKQVKPVMPKGER